MAAQYDFVENPNTRGEGKKQTFHPRIVSKGTIDTETLINSISESCTLTPADLKAALSALSGQLARYLREGYQVEMAGMGFFSATLKARPVTDKREIRSTSVSFDKVNFRACAQLKKNIQGELERHPQGFRHSSGLSSEACRRFLVTYLEDHPYITRSEYSRLTGRLKNKALKELHRCVAEGWLAMEGAGTHQIFVRLNKDSPGKV